MNTAARSYKIKTDFVSLRNFCTNRLLKNEELLVIGGHAVHWQKYIQDCPRDNLDSCLLCFQAYVQKIPAQTLQAHLGSFLFALLSEHCWTNRPCAEDTIIILFKNMIVYKSSFQWLKQLLNDDDEYQVARVIHALAVLNEYYGPTKLEKHNDLVHSSQQVGESQMYIEARSRFENANSVFEENQLKPKNQEQLPREDITKTFTWEWCDVMKRERMVSKKKDGLEQMLRTIEESDVIKADMSDIVNFLISTSRQFNNPIKKLAIDIAVALQQKLGRHFDTSTLDLLGPFIEMAEKETMEESLLEFLDKTMKSLSFQVLVPALLNWMQTGFREGVIMILKYLLNTIFSEKDRNKIVDVLDEMLNGLFKLAQMPDSKVSSKSIKCLGLLQYKFEGPEIFEKQFDMMGDSQQMEALKGRIEEVSQYE